jgi:hypothetical protein
MSERTGVDVSTATGVVSGTASVSATLASPTPHPDISAVTARIAETVAVGKEIRVFMISSAYLLSVVVEYNTSSV